jgi:hypothetical protein
MVHYDEHSPLCALAGDRVAALSGRADQVMRGLRMLAQFLVQRPRLEPPGQMHPALAARLAAASAASRQNPHYGHGGYGGYAAAPHAFGAYASYY